MNFRPMIALALSLALASPAAAQTRVAAGVYQAPAGISVVPALGGAGVFAAPSLNSGLASPSLAPGLTAAPAPSMTPVAAPAAALAAAVPVLPVAAVTAALPAPAAAAKAAVPGASRELPASVSPVALRAEGEQFWSGAASKPEADDSVPATAAQPAPARSGLLRGGAAFAPALLPVSAAASLPSWASAALPYAEGVGAVAAAYGLIRVSRWVIDKLAARFGWDKNTVVLARFASSGALWIAGVSTGLVALGVPEGGMMTALGAGAGVTGLSFMLSPTIKDVAGNLFQGVRFLLARPFTIGDKVTIGKTTGDVHDLTLRYMVIKAEDGSFVLRTYNQVAAAPVTLYGSYQTKLVRLKLLKPALPHGLLRAIKDAATPALWKPVLWSAGAIAALSFFPMLAVGVKASAFTWVAAVLPWIKGGLFAVLTASISRSLSTGISKLAARYGWSRPVATVVKLGTSLLSWMIGGSFLLNAVGISWAALGVSLIVSTALVSVMINDQLNAAIQGAIVLKLKPFQIGDKVSIGDNAGEVVDVTLDHVVLKLDGERFMLVPHAVVKESAITTPREYGARAQ